MNAPREAPWPSLPLAEWQATHDTLHMWMQIVGKTRLALAPRQNHWWNVPLYLTSRGLTTTPMPYGLRTLTVEFDFVDHRLVLETSDGASRAAPLRPQAVAEFYREYQGLLSELGVPVKIWPVPVEVDHPIPFAEDRTHALYEPGQAQRFFRMLSHADRILKRFAGRFLGKSSPVHFFWGARSRAHPVLRPAGAREGRERVVGPPGGELPRGDQSRILVRKRRGTGARVLRVRAPRASGPGR
jgi:hypothetical protein